MVTTLPVRDYSTIEDEFPSNEALADFRRRQIEDGYEFPLTATSLGRAKLLKIRARRLSLYDRAALEILPMHVQNVIWAGLKAMQKAVEQATEQNRTPESLLDMLAGNERTLLAADKYFCACAIEPQFVETEQELAANPKARLLTHIREEDRVDFFLACMNADSDAAKKLQMFRPREAASVPAPAGATSAAGAPVPIIRPRPEGDDSF